MAINETLYTIGKIGLSTDGMWFVNYTGDVPEQGGFRFGTGQLFFDSLSDALNFLTEKTLEYENTYREIIKNKTQKVNLNDLDNALKISKMIREFNGYECSGPECTRKEAKLPKNWETEARYTATAGDYIGNCYYCENCKKDIK